MKKKFLGRLLTMLLVAAMVFTLLPASAIAAAEWWGGDEYADDAATQATDDYKYNIFFLDCGRKYYSVDSIKQFIDNASAAGFNYIQLAVGNDGLRFLLNDMSLTVNGTTYESDAVKSAIHAGNEAYYNFDVDELTQSEMDTIIDYANSKGMGVIPCVNTPGHMDAILSAANTLTGKNCSYNSSVRTIDVTNTTATAFTKALLQKYITYFAGKGCQLFNMGADEYANDKYTGGSMGFGNLQSTGNYSYYVTYVNQVAAMIKAAKMIPMAFNDGIYFNNNTWSGMFDTDIIICYWSNGWSGYSPMPAATLAGMGFKMVNTNGDYYWVLGKTDAQCSASKASGFNYKSFPGSTIDAPAGSMFCIWADYPGAETESDVISGTADTIAAFGGTLPKLATQPTVTITAKDNNTKLDLTNPTETLLLTASEVVTWHYDSSVVTLSSADEATSNAFSTYAVDSTVRAKSVYVQAVSGAAATDTEIKVSNDSGKEASLTVTLSDPNAKKDGGTINLTVGEEKSVTINGSYDEAEVDGTSATAAVKPTTEKQIGNQFTSYGLSQSGVFSNGKNYMVIDADGKISSTTDINEATEFTVNKSGNYYQISAAVSNKEYYLCLVYSNSRISLGTQTDTYDWSYSSYYGFYRSSYSIYYSDNDGWAVSYYYYGDSNCGLYSVSTKPGESSTTITFTGVAPGTTYVTVGDTEYTIIVDYKQETVNAVLDQSTTVNVSGDMTTGPDTSVARVSVSNGVMTVTGVSEGKTSVIVGNTKYTIIVTKEDLSKVDDLTIEYWITNSKATGVNADDTNSGLTSITIAASTQGIATEAGVAVSDLVHPKATKDGRKQVFWQCKLLDVEKDNSSTSGTELQTTKAGDDETLNGTAFTKIRYYNSSWQVFTTQWVSVDRTQVSVTYTNDSSNTVKYTGDKNQLVAYYMEVIDIKNANGNSELNANAADWGTKGDGTGSWGYTPESNRCSVSVQIVYEDGSANPAATTAADLKSKTIVYGYWDGGRGLGTMVLTGQGYQIYKVTAETGTMTSTTGSGNTVTVTDFTWAKNEVAVWEGTAQDSVSIGNPARSPSYEEPYDHLAWNTGAHLYNNAILIRVYVKAQVTEDSLKVHYIDATNGGNTEFYQYSISVAEGTQFDPNYGRDNNGKLINNTVTNYNGAKQTVTSDLSKMPEIGAAYRHAAYNFYATTRSENGKDVYLYYTFSRTASFIADFGLPITISLDQINDTLGSANVTDIQVSTQKYGDVTTDVSAKTITYTPTKTFDKDIESLQVTVSGKIDITNETGTTTKADNVTYTVYILPASNVLYEESFLTKADGWTKGDSAAPTTAQETQKAKETKNVFGYDNAYVANNGNNVTGELGVWKADGLTTTTKTGALITSFYGNAFDLIGNCEPNSGRVILYVSGNGTSRLIDIDTRYNGGTISQVPLAHIELGKADASYDIAVYASGLKATGLKATGSYSTQSVMRASSTDPVLQSLLNTYGLTMADVEYVSMSASTASAVSSIATYATAATVDHQKGTHVEIDGFRVYRSTTDSVADNYPANEKNVTYKNILDVVKGKITAYTEINGNAEVDVANYEANGGPQNEIYLGEGQAVTFKLSSAGTIQVSLRAVSGTAQWATSDSAAAGEIKDITSNTEMYYEVTSDANGSVTIANRGNTLLAIGNVKLPAGVSTKSASEMDKTAVYESVCAAFATSLPVDPEPDQTVFVPEHFSIRNYATPLFRHKLVTLRIDFSKDVSYVEIDGQKYYPSKFAGWFGYYTVTFTDTIGRNENYFYKVVFFDANGNPSETQSVYGK